MSGTLAEMKEHLMTTLIPQTVKFGGRTNNKALGSNKLTTAWPAMMEALLLDASPLWASSQSSNAKGKQCASTCASLSSANFCRIQLQPGFCHKAILILLQMHVCCGFLKAQTDYNIIRPHAKALSTV